MSTVIRFDRANRLGKARRTQLGGVAVPARLSRTGVLVYVLPDATVRRELRHPDEVFKADSLATLAHAPVIDIRDHTGMVTPETFRSVALGSVVEVKQDGDFIAGELVVNDADALEAIDAGERTEISCGYQCELDYTPGTYDGEAYDCVQRDIRYNHVALCPPNRGRAGPEVGLRLDHGGNAIMEETTNMDAHEHLTIEVAKAVREAKARDAWRADATGRPRARSKMSGTIGGVNVPSRTVPIVASTPAPVDGVAITSWDLSRFERNPVILWAHSQVDLPIGFASEIEATPEGLKMLVTLATERANPLAECVLNAASEGVVRAVSVGYELVGPGQARLIEVSFVPVGADENAGTPALTEGASDESNVEGADRQRYFSSLPERDEDGEPIEHDDSTDDNAITRARAKRDRAMANLSRAPIPTPNANPSTRTDETDDDGEAAVEAARQRMLDRFAAMGR